MKTKFPPRTSRLILSSVLSIALSGMLAAPLGAFEIESVPDATKRLAPESEAGVVYSYHDSIKGAIAAVVNISTQKKIKSSLQQNPMFNDPFFQQFFGDLYSQIPKDRVERALGSGVIISSDGYIITNNHVIDGADKILVTLPDSTKEYSATLVGADPDSDLAVIRIDKQDLPYIKFANSSNVMVGDVVFAIGNPFGVGETVTKGIISALNKNGMGINNYENFIQTDTSINPGNSGGALIDTRGALVGINTAIISRSGGNLGIGFAIPSDMVKHVVSQLIKDGKIERGYLGVGLQDITNDLRESYANNDGAVVINLDKDSPAKRAGVMVWDLITEINGKKVKNSADLKNFVGTLKPNQDVTLKVLRDKKELTLTLKLAERTKGKKDSPVSTKGSDEGELKGLRVESITPQMRQRYNIASEVQGVIVTSVAEDSPAQEAGFNQGDIIAQIENMAIKSTSDFTNALNRFKGKTKRILVYTPNGVKTIVTK